MKIGAILLAVVGLSGAVTGGAAEPAKQSESPDQAVARQAQVLAAGTLRLQQRALRRLGEIRGSAADRLIGEKLDDLEAGRLPLGLWLDLLESAGKRTDLALMARLAAREKQLAGEADRMKPWRECLEGGDASEGRTIFRERVEAGCIRCHRLANEGGEIGPDLTALSQRAERISILESIIEPNSFIVPGFKHVALQLQSGGEVSGILNFEGSDLLRLTSVTDGKKFTVATKELTKETALPSAMPPGLGAILGKRAIRDLVEFLATQE